MSKKKTNEIDRRMFKKEGEELQQYLHFRKRGSVVKNKKGKGSYKREKKNWGDEQWWNLYENLKIDLWTTCPTGGNLQKKIEKRGWQNLTLML